jgi:hypothetical protein
MITRQTLVLSLLVLIIANLLVLPSTKGDLGIIEFEDKEVYLKCNLTVVSPDSKIAYNNSMPVNFTIDWNSTIGGVFWILENTSISIDGKQPILLGSYMLDIVNLYNKTTYQSTVDISDLQVGEHKLDIIVTGLCNIGNDFLKSFNVSFSPIYFDVGTLPATSISPTASPSVPEFPIISIILLMITLVSVLAVSRKRILVISR